MTRVPLLAICLAPLGLLACGDDDSPGPIAQPAVQDVVVVSGDMQEAEVGTPVPDVIVLRAVNQQLEPMPNARFTLFPTDEGFVSQAGQGGGASGNGSSYTTDADHNGELRVNWRLTTQAGFTAFRVAAYLSGQTDSAEVFVRGLAHPGPLENVVLENNNQAGPTGAELPLPVGVMLLDYFGNPLFQVSVDWAVVSGGGSLDQTTVLSDENGRSRVYWTLGAAAGDQRVSATIENGGGTVIFTAVAQ